MSEFINYNKLKKNKKNLIMKIIFVITIIYIVYAMYLIIKNPTETIVVEQGVVTEEEMATGYILRSEVVVKGNNYKNGIFQILSEGEKAAKNQTIFRYYGKSEEELQANIDDINLKIQEALEKEKNSIYISDSKNLESQIEEKIQNLKNLNDVQMLSEQKKDIYNIVQKRAKIIGENSKSGSYIKKLINEKEEYEKKLSEGSEYIKAPVSGIVSYRVDGFEEILGIDNFDDLSVESLENLDIKTGKIISSNNESAKIIDDFNCYLATVLDSEIAQKAEVGDNINITLSSGEEIKSSIVYKKFQDDGRILIVFKVPVLTEELMSYRKISFNITWWTYSGIKVPNDSIIEENGLKYVIKKTKKGDQKVLVKILKKNQYYSVVSSYSTDDLENLNIESEENYKINVYDTIYVSPK